MAKRTRKLSQREMDRITHRESILVRMEVLLKRKLTPTERMNYGRMSLELLGMIEQGFDECARGRV